MISAKKFREAKERYVLSISRENVVTEKVETDRRDNYGHVIYENVPVVNSLGEQVTFTEFLVPPSVEGFCMFAGIYLRDFEQLQTTENYGTVCDDLLLIIQKWNVEQLLTRKGKNIPGIKFNLENNFGMKERTEITSAGDDLHNMSMKEKKKVLDELLKKERKEGK